MASVQYNPVPDQGVEARPTPQVHVNTPAEAFGGGIARAVEHFGGSLEHVGNELFTRAVALQHLQNETEAREADARYMAESGRLHAEYNSLEGKAAVDAYPQYIKNLQKSRTDIRDGLSNNASRNMYDTQSMGFMGRNIFNGAGHAATEQRKWSIGASQARLDGWESDALSNPKDEASFQRGLSGTVHETEQLADLHGMGEDQKDNLISHHVSKLWASRIIGLAKTSPFEAKEMLEANRKSIRGQDLLKLDEVVRGKMYDVGSRNVSDAVNSGWAPYMKQGDIDKTVGVEDSLLRVVKEAQRAHPELTFTIGGKGGKRTVEEQKELVAQGRSQTMDSDHLRGQAIDIVPLVGGKQDYEAKEQYTRISEAMEEAATKLGIPLAPKSEKFKSWDPGHFSLPKDFDPRSVPKAREEDERSRVNRAKSWARAQYPEDEVFQDRVAERVMTDYNREARQRRDDEFNASQTLRGVIETGYGPGGKLPTTVEELTISPDAAAAWDKLTPTQQGGFRKVLAQINKGDVAETPERRSKFEELRGLSITDPAKFLDTDLNEVDLSLGFKRQLWNLQFNTKKQIEKGEVNDPRVTHALRVLTDANILYPKKTTSEATYNKFIGNLSEQLRAWRDEHKKAPSDKEIREMGTRLLMTQPEPGRLFGTNNTRMFELRVPKDVEKAIKDDPAWQATGIEPTPERIQQIYVRSQYQRLYEKKEPPQAPAKPPETLQATQPKGGQKAEDVKRPGLMTKEQQRAKPKPNPNFRSAQNND